MTVRQENCSCASRVDGRVVVVARTRKPWLRLRHWRSIGRVCPGGRCCRCGRNSCCAVALVWFVCWLTVQVVRIVLALTRWAVVLLVRPTGCMSMLDSGGCWHRAWGRCCARGLVWRHRPRSIGRGPEVYGWRRFPSTPPVAHRDEASDLTKSRMARNRPSWARCGRRLRIGPIGDKGQAPQHWENHADGFGPLVQGEFVSVRVVKPAS